MVVIAAGLAQAIEGVAWLTVNGFVDGEGVVYAWLVGVKMTERVHAPAGKTVPFIATPDLLGQTYE
jgi:hypothetical protein